MTYFERPHKDDVLSLMYRMLKFTPEEKQRVESGRVGIGGRLKGWVSYLPSLMADGGQEGGAMKSVTDDSSLADLWVDFLLAEAEKGAGGAAASASASPVGVAPETTTPHLTPTTQSRIAANAAAMPSFQLPSSAVGAAAAGTASGTYPAWSPPPGQSVVAPQAAHFQHSGQFAAASPSPVAPVASPEMWPPASMQIMAQHQQHFQMNSQPPMFAPPQPNAFLPSSAMMPPAPLQAAPAIPPPPIANQFPFPPAANGASLAHFASLSAPQQQPHAQPTWSSSFPAAATTNATATNDSAAATTDARHSTTLTTSAS